MGAGPARLLRSLLLARRRALVLAMLGAFGYLATMLAQPLVIRHGVQGLIDDDEGPVWTAGFVLLGMGALRAGFGALRKYQASVLMAQIGQDLRDRLHVRMQELDLAFHKRLGSGQLLSRAAGDATAIEQFVGIAPFFTQALLLGLGGFVLMLVLSPLLTAVVVPLVVVTAALALRAGRQMYPISTALQDLVGEYTTFVKQQVHGIRVVKGHGFEAAHREVGGDLAAGVQQLGVGLGRQRARFLAGFLAVPGLATLVALAFGGRLVLHSDLGAADLLAFVQYLGMLMMPLMVSAQVLSSWPQVRAASVRAQAVLDAEPTVTSPADPLPLPQAAPSLTFRGVTFGHVEGEPVLHGLDLHVPAGATVALVGGSGSGTTTILQLALRFADPWEGAVLLDGVDLRELDLAELRSQLCMVFQQPHLFAATIAENVAQGDPAATREAVAEALSRACCDPMLAVLPAGADTEVGERGTSLSGGQRQRVSVARALVRTTPVLLLDDVASALDPTTAAALRTSIAALLPGRTAIVVARDWDTIRTADLVAVLDRGRVVAFGTPDELEGSPALSYALALPVPS